jgi:hypothetical protein
MKSVLDPLDTSFRGIVDRVLGALGQGSDDNTGSVLRTLIEACAREMATFYAMLDLAHRSGYLETAEGAALDSVVALLGIQRARAGRLTGKIELSRLSPAPQDIGVPAGLRVTGALPDGTMLPLFETVEDVVLVRGTLRVTAEIQEVQDPATRAPPLINPRALTIMPRPPLGVEAITNLDPIRQASSDETDEHLRARARLSMRQAQRGTLEAITAAVTEQGVEKVEVREPMTGPPGVIEVLIGDPDFERDLAAQSRVLRAIRATKAAGVRADLRFLRTVYLQPTIVVEPVDPVLDDRGFERLRGELRAALARFVGDLPIETDVSRRKLEAIVFGHPGVKNIARMTLGSFSLVPDEQHPLDPTRLRQETRGRGVTGDGDVIVGRFERPAIDLVRFPPIVARERAPQLQLDLVVRARVADAAAREAGRTAINAWITHLPTLENRASKKVLAALSDAYAAVHPPSAEGKHDNVLLAVLTDENGLAETITVQTFADFDAEARVVLGGLEVVAPPAEDA